MPPQLFNSSSDDPFKRLKDRFVRRMKEDMISEKMLDVVKDAYTELIRSENIILSRKEQNRLLQAVVQEMVEEILASFSDER